jgi:hypothetical protein
MNPGNQWVRKSVTHRIFQMPFSGQIFDYRAINPLRIYSFISDPEGVFKKLSMHFGVSASDFWVIQFVQF